MWFLHRKVVLTKDNLAKRNWKGDPHCPFCGNNESVEHLFISCPFAKLVWRVVFCTYNIPPPTNVTNMFGNWLNGMDTKTKDRIRIGVSAICWSIWNYRNNLFLTGNKLFMSYRLSIWRCTGSSYGLSCCLWTSGTLWRLDARGFCGWHCSILGDFRSCALPIAVFL